MLTVQEVAAGAVIAAVAALPVLLLRLTALVNHPLNFQEHPLPLAELLLVLHKQTVALEEQPPALPQHVLLLDEEHLDLGAVGVRVFEVLGREVGLRQQEDVGDEEGEGYGGDGAHGLQGREW